MSSDANVTPPPPNNGSPAVAATPPPAGLPTVAPPSGKLMMQLFLVPGLIVAFLIGAWLVGGWLFGVSYSKKDFLEKLNDANAEVRWRAGAPRPGAARDDALASDGDFARQLGLMLEKAARRVPPGRNGLWEIPHRSSPEGAGREEATGEDRRRARRTVEPDRNFISFLTASLGDFMVPVGAPF